MNTELFYDLVFEPDTDHPAETVYKILNQPFFGRSKWITAEYMSSHILVIIGSHKFVAQIKMKYINEVLELDKRIDRYRST